MSCLGVLGTRAVPYQHIEIFRRAVSHSTGDKHNTFNGTARYVYINTFTTTTRSPPLAAAPTTMTGRHPIVVVLVGAATRG